MSNTCSARCLGGIGSGPRSVRALLGQFRGLKDVSVSVAVPFGEKGFVGALLGGGVSVGGVIGRCTLGIGGAGGSVALGGGVLVDKSFTLS